MGGETRLRIEALFERFGEREVRICDMDAPRHHLLDEAGGRYEEVETNIWGLVLPPGERRILYLGTGRHGGGIILRALYVRTDEGEWLNATTGDPASFPVEQTAAW